MIFKNVAGQGVYLYAFDAAANLPKAGDAANITGSSSKDGGGRAALATTNPLEVDPVNMAGVYWQPLSQAESDGNALAFAWSSTTPNVSIEPLIAFTTGGAIPQAAFAAPGGLPTCGTGNNQISLTGGLAAASLDAANVTGNLPADAQAINGVSTSPVTAVHAHVGQDQSPSFALVGGVQLLKADVEGVAGQGVQTSSGTAQGGSSNSITLASTASATDNAYRGWRAFRLDTEEWAIVTGYVGSTKVATIRGSWAGAAPTGGVTQYDLDPPASSDVEFILGAASGAAAGYVGIDWSHVNAPTTTVNLSGTTISAAQGVASVSGAVGSVTGNVGGSVGSVSGVTFPANFSALEIDGSGRVDLSKWNGTALAGAIPPDVVFVRSGTAQGGSASTITLDAGASAVNNQYQNQIIFIRQGTGAGQSAIIASYVGSTKVATINGTWATNPDGTSVFTIEDFGAIAASVAGNVTVGGYVAGQDPASYVLAAPANKLATDGTGRVTVGSNADKSGYSLSQAFPANFASMAITVGGAVTVGTNNDKSGYGLSQSFPANFAAMSISGGGKVASTVATGDGADAASMLAIGLSWVTPANHAVATPAFLANAPSGAGGGGSGNTNTTLLNAPRDLTSAADDTITWNDVGWAVMALAGGNDVSDGAHQKMTTPGGTAIRNPSLTLAANPFGSNVPVKRS